MEATEEGSASEARETASGSVNGPVAEWAPDGNTGTSNAGGEVAESSSEGAAVSERRTSVRRESGVAFMIGGIKLADTGAVEETPSSAAGASETASSAPSSSSASSGDGASAPAPAPEAVHGEVPILEYSSSSRILALNTTEDGSTKISTLSPHFEEETTSASNSAPSVTESAQTASTEETAPSQVQEEAQAPAAAAATTSAPAKIEISAPAPSQTEAPRANTASHRVSIKAEPKTATCTVEVRTQSGEVFTFEGIAWTTSIIQLKQLVFTKHKKFEIDEIRLLKNGKPLDDDHVTIDAAGFKNKDTVFVIRKLKTAAQTGQGVSVSTSGPSPPPGAATGSRPAAMSDAQSDIVTVQCPPGHGPGSRLRIRPAGREPMLVTVPAGVPPGGYFRVMLPPLSQGAPQQQQQQQHHQQQQQQRPLNQQPGFGGAPRPKVMAVTCPPGLRPGDLMEVLVPGVGRMRVPIPRGISPGQDFRFRLPD